MPKCYTMYQELLSQNHFWHVLQTCLDQGEMIFCPAQFFRVNFLLVTCAYKRGSLLFFAPPRLHKSPAWLSLQAFRTMVAFLHLDGNGALRSGVSVGK